MATRKSIKSVGFDIGKVNDHPALVELSGSEESGRASVTNSVMLPLGLAYPDLVKAVRPFLFGADLIMVDGSGVGRAIFDFIRKEYPQAWAVVTTGSTGASGASGASGSGEPSCDPEERLIKIPKAMMIERLLSDLENLLLSFRAVGHYKVLSDQMKNFECLPSSKSRSIQYQAKAGHHDDLVMALALARVSFYMQRIKPCPGLQERSDEGPAWQDRASAAPRSPVRRRRG